MTTDRVYVEFNFCNKNLPQHLPPQGGDTVADSIIVPPLANSCKKVVKVGGGDMTHSEKATVIALHHSKMFSQGKRNDILEQLKTLENPHSNEENGTCAQVGHKLKSREIIAEDYNLSRNTIARYLRVNQLISALKSRLDNGSLAFIPAVTLSFLKDSEQASVDDCMNQYNFTVDMKKADMLRDFSEKGKLGSDSILQILSGNAAQKPKSNHTTSILTKLK